MKLIIFTTVSVLSGFGCFAQSDSLSNNTAIADSNTARSTLTIGAVYSINADYYGQAALQKLPYAAVAASYRHKSGLYITALAYKLINEKGGSIASAENVGAGIDFKLSKKLSADISYSHTFYPGHSPFLQAGNPDNASVSLSYDAWIKPFISADYAFGNNADVFTTGGISKQVTLGSISKKDVVSITPAFSVVGGTQKYYQTYITEKKLTDSLLGIIFQPPPGQGAGNSSFTKTITAFNILSYNVKMPLDYTRAHYMVEASAQFSMLSNHAEAGPGKVNSFFTCSFYYQF